MRLQRSRQVGRGRRPSREAAARARENTPSDAEAAAREGGDEAAGGEESRVEGQRLIPVAERQFAKGLEIMIVKVYNISD